MTFCWQCMSVGKGTSLSTLREIPLLRTKWRISRLAIYFEFEFLLLELKVRNPKYMHCKITFDTTLVCLPTSKTLSPLLYYPCLSVLLDGQRWAICYIAYSDVVLPLTRWSITQITTVIINTRLIWMNLCVFKRLSF